jgi:hypothetical protein
MLTYKNPKAKSCVVCERVFVPERMGQVVCRGSCGIKKARADRVAVEKAERESVKRRKEALKRVPDLIKEAQTAFNAWVRARDAAQPCISCDAPPPDMSTLHAGRDAGHYRSTGSASHLRFHPDNCHAQCVKCNQWGAGMAVDYRIRLLRRIGPARVEELESSNAPHKWTADELRGIRDHYRQKLKDTLKGRTC